MENIYHVGDKFTLPAQEITQNGLKYEIAERTVVITGITYQNNERFIILDHQPNEKKWIKKTDFEKWQKILISNILTLSTRG